MFPFKQMRFMEMQVQRNGLSRCRYFKLRSHDTFTDSKRWKMVWISVPYFWKSQIAKNELQLPHFGNEIVWAIENDESGAFFHFSNNTDWLLMCRYLSLTSKSLGQCNVFTSIKFPNIFKSCRYRVNVVSVSNLS